VEGERQRLARLELEVVDVRLRDQVERLALP
jgi:hypothetical protein